MNTLQTYNHLATLSEADAVEFIAGKVNICDIDAIMGFAEFDGNSQLAYDLWNAKDAA